MHFGYTCDFRSPRRLQQILSEWNTVSPLTWQAFENEQRGPYLVARDAALNLRIRLYGEAGQYSLELDANVPESEFETVRQRLLTTLLDILLPAISATDITDTSEETSGR